MERFRIDNADKITAVNFIPKYEVYKDLTYQPANGDDVEGFYWIEKYFFGLIKKKRLTTTQEMINEGRLVTDGKVYMKPYATILFSDPKIDYVSKTFDTDEEAADFAENIGKLYIKNPIKT